MRQPIHEILRRIGPLAAKHKASHLRGLIASEPKRSMRRAELEAALKAIVNKQLQKDNERERHYG